MTRIQEPSKNIALENELKNATEENDNLLLEVGKLQDVLSTLSETIKILEAKLYKSEATCCELTQKNKKLYNDKVDEIHVLKSVLKNNNDKILKYENDCKDNKKVLKSKEKEIHNLENKTNNQLHTISNLKNNNNQLKNDMKKLEKDAKKNVAQTKNTKSADSNGNDFPIYSCYACDKTMKAKVDMKEHIEKMHVDLQNLEGGHKPANHVEEKLKAAVEETIEDDPDPILVQETLVDTGDENIKLCLTKTYPLIAALIINCVNCTVSNAQNSFNFKICDTHNTRFDVLISNIKEPCPILP